MLRHPRHTNSAELIDMMPCIDAMSMMLNSQVRALQVVADATAALCRAAGLVAVALEVGRTVHYAAAGSSGLMALADACELPGTFGVSQHQIRINMAGGVPVDGCMPGETEDSEAAAEAVGPGDVAIVISASGTTPYAVSFARQAAQNGAKVIGIANVAGSTLLELADVAVVLETPQEVVEGSTRLGAGTAQKAALNLISTQAGVLLGHVHQGMMINLKPENAKLRSRAVQIVARLAGVSDDEALGLLQQVDFDTKLATLLAYDLDVEQATKLLEQHRGRLAPCLQAVCEKAGAKVRV